MSEPDQLVYFASKQYLTQPIDINLLVSCISVSIFNIESFYEIIKSVSSGTKSAADAVNEIIAKESSD